MKHYHSPKKQQKIQSCIYFINLNKDQTITRLHMLDLMPRVILRDNRCIDNTVRVRTSRILNKNKLIIHVRNNHITKEEVMSIIHSQILARGHRQHHQNHQNHQNHQIHLNVNQKTN